MFSGNLKVPLKSLSNVIVILEKQKYFLIINSFYFKF